MTPSPFIPAAPPPGSPPPTAPVVSSTTQEERILAAASYLGYVAGFWLIVPIVIYVLKREQSRFVAHHALRAVLLHLLAVPVLILGWLLAMVGSFALASVFEDRRPDSAFGAAFLVTTVLAWLLPWFAFLVVTVLGAVRAFQGRIQTGSLFGRIVERLLGQDRTVTAAAAPAR
jgi:uncharacterized Tic20 family protein